MLTSRLYQLVLRFVTTEQDRGQPTEVRRGLFSTVSKGASNVFMVALAMAVCGLCAFIREDGWVLPAIAAFGIVLFLMRCHTITTISRLRASGVAIDPDFWLPRFALTALATSVCWGLLSFCAIVFSRDPLIISIIVISNVGTAGSVAARNAGTPKLAKLMLIFYLMPICVGSLFAQDPGYWVLSALVLAMTAGLFILINEHNAQLVDLFVSRQALFRLSNIDALTQVSNRRRFDELLEGALAGGAFAVLMADVDYFKAFNDHYGHPEGDDCLKQIAATLLGCVRDSDTVSRYGGEEFAILVAGEDPAATAMVAGRITAAVAAMGRRHDNRPDDISIVTISIGIAAMKNGYGDADTLIKAADDALYTAKRNGRNRYYFAPTPAAAIPV